MYQITGYPIYMSTTANIPMQTIGPIKIIGPEVDDDVMVPLATYESPLWPSTLRGAKVTAHAGGIKATILSEKMTRSSVLEAGSAVEAIAIAQQLQAHRLPEMAEIPKQYSRFTQLTDMNCQVVGKLLYCRFEFTTGDASGHNMVTLAAEHLINWLQEQYPELSYVSISGNYCTDKKVSAVNGILGRGKYVVAEATISRKLCQRFLKTTPEKIADINIKKNLIGSILAGSLRSANADYANRLLGFYLATGQDAANIIEGSQGITHAEVCDDQLYFSVTLPNLIVGSIGNGKELDFVKENLIQLGCMDTREPGMNARRLAIIAACTVLCGELSLLAAQTNPGELMQSHIAMERKAKGESHA